MGERKIKGSHDTTGIWGNTENRWSGGWHKADYIQQGYTGKDGTETVAAWHCTQDCPVRALDALSGSLTSGSGNTKRLGIGFCGGSSGTIHAEANNGDTGGASRFYPQFASFAEALDWLTRLIGGPET